VVLRDSRTGTNLGRSTLQRSRSPALDLRDSRTGTNLGRPILQRSRSPPVDLRITETDPEGLGEDLGK